MLQVTVARMRSAKRALLVGTGPLVRDLLEVVENDPHCGYYIDGVVTERNFSGASYHDYPVLGSVESLTQILLDIKPEVIIVAHKWGSVELFKHQLLEASLSLEICIERAASVYERLTGKIPLEAYEMEDVIYSDTFRPGRLSLLATRFLSLGAALLGLILFAPLMLLIALLIKLDSPGTVLFRQERAGFRGKPFMVMKFRTMVATEEPESEWEGDNAHRITRTGHWLRKFRLDELPQFFNILRGEMNLVGPRPHPASNIALLSLVARNTAESGVAIPYYALRSSVRPGITGWAQVRYRYANNLQEEIEKLHYDLYYLKHYSLWLDLRILLETVWVVVAGHGVKAEAAQEETPDRASGAAPDGQTTAP